MGIKTFHGMNKRTLIINGDNFSDEETFYCEIDNILTKDLDWQTGHNQNAFNDLLYGGFGVHESGESLKLIWAQFSKSKDKMGDDLVGELVEIIKSHEHIEFETIN